MAWLSEIARHQAAPLEAGMLKYGAAALGLLRGESAAGGAARSI